MRVEDEQKKDEREAGFKVHPARLGLDHATRRRLWGGRGLNERRGCWQGERSTSRSVWTASALAALSDSSRARWFGEKRRSGAAVQTLRDARALPHPFTHSAKRPP